MSSVAAALGVTLFLYHFWELIPALLPIKEKLIDYKLKKTKNKGKVKTHSSGSWEDGGVTHDVDI